MKKRSRRKVSEIEKLRSKMLKIVKLEGEISLTSLVRQYGASVGIKDTASDKHLAKRQLDILAKSGGISFDRHGRDLIARSAAPAAQQAAAPPAAAAQPGAIAALASPGLPVASAAPPVGSASAPELAAVRVYSQYMKGFSKSLRQQVSTLVRMIEQATP